MSDDKKFQDRYNPYNISDEERDRFIEEIEKKYGHKKSKEWKPIDIKVMILLVFGMVASLFFVIIGIASDDSELILSFLILFIITLISTIIKLKNHNIKKPSFEMDTMTRIGLIVISFGVAAFLLALAISSEGVLTVLCAIGCLGCIWFGLYNISEIHTQKQIAKANAKQIILKQKPSLKEKIKHSTIFKEIHYKRIARFHKYYECGSITKEEFEKIKADILSKIN